MTILPFQKKLDPRLDTLFKRLNLFRLPGETDKAFAKRLDVSLAQFNRWKKGAGITYNTLCKIGEVVTVDIDWLYTGRGSSEIYSQDGSDSVSIPKGMHIIRLEKVEPSAETAHG